MIVYDGDHTSCPCNNLRLIARALVRCISQSPLLGLVRVTVTCRILDLSACRGISVSSLQSALPQLKQLEVLHLDGNPEVCTPCCTPARCCVRLTCC